MPKYMPDDRNIYGDFAAGDKPLRTRAAAKAPHMNEAQFQERVTGLCDWLRLRWFHDNDARRNREGFPDLVISGPGGVVFAELKSTKGRISTAQQDWHDSLSQTHEHVYFWRPEDWPEVERILKQIAGRA